MRSELPLVPVAVGLAAAFALVATLLVAPDLIAAEPGKPASADKTAPCACADSETRRSPPAFRADPRASLDDNDRLAALEALQLALSEVGDGASYVWHARTGRLSGVVKPTQSFKDPVGRICRHITVLLTAGNHSRRTEGMACRLASGIWQLEG